MLQILKLKIGSHLYGTNTPYSDVDYAGVFIPDEKYIYGIDNVKEISNNVKSKHLNNKNTSDAIDDKLYEIRNFIRLLKDNNPNILEMVFVDTKNIIQINELGQLLLDSAYLFPNQAAINKFIAYSNSQRHRMLGKQERNINIQKAYDHFSTHEYDITYLVELKELNLDFWQYNHGRFSLGELNIQGQWNVSKLLEVLNQRINSTSSRMDLVEQYGYDTKFASHMIRLKYEILELMETGKLTFPLVNSDIILGIKSGKIHKEECLALDNILMYKINNNIESTVLPKSYNYDDISDLCIKLVKMGLRLSKQQ